MFSCDFSHSLTHSLTLSLSLSLSLSPTHYECLDALAIIRQCGINSYSLLHATIPSYMCVYAEIENPFTIRST